jgi:hypothetical protein
VVSHSFPFWASRRLKLSHNSILPCTAFPSTLVSMLELSPPLPILLLPRVGGLSALSTRAVHRRQFCRYDVVNGLKWECAHRQRPDKKDFQPLMRLVKRYSSSTTFLSHDWGVARVLNGTVYTVDFPVVALSVVLASSRFLVHFLSFFHDVIIER